MRRPAATDPVGNSAIAHSTVNVFDVPKVEITEPNEGAKLSGTATVAADVGAEPGVERVEFFVDGQAAAMDDPSAHEGEVVRELWEARGWEVPLLPSYPPDFPPTEEAFSEPKARLRGEEARTTSEALVEAIGRALDALTPVDARGRFAHCGHASAQSS